MKSLFGWSLIALGVLCIPFAFQIIGKEFGYSQVGIAHTLQSSVLTMQLISTAIGSLLPSVLLIYFGRRVLPANRVKAREKQLSSLALAAAEGDLQAVREWLQLGYDVNCAAKDGSTPLMYAVRNGYREIVVVLLDAGANPQLRTKKSDSAFDIACRFHKNDLADLLRAGMHVSH